MCCSLQIFILKPQKFDLAPVYESKLMIDFEIQVAAVAQS